MPHPKEISRAIGSGTIHSADLLRVAESRQAIQGIHEDSAAGTALQQRQSATLRQWAEANDLFIDHRSFTEAWFQQTARCGQAIRGNEQQVLFVAGLDTVHKRKLLWPYETWDDYFLRLEAHAEFFPETAYTLLGFSDAPYSQGTTFMARVAQPFSERERDATEEEIRSYLAEKGFSPFEDPLAVRLGIRGFKFLKWRHQLTGHILSDLGPNNLWIDTRGNVAVVDPMIEHPDRFHPS